MEAWRETVDVVKEEVDDVVQKPSWEDRLEGVRRVVWERGVRWCGERGGRGGETGSGLARVGLRGDMGGCGCI
jgi:hypothetical protein